jgi:hypothetical protein
VNPNYTKLLVCARGSACAHLGWWLLWFGVCASAAVWLATAGWLACEARAVMSGPKFFSSRPPGAQGSWIPYVGGQTRPKSVAAICKAQFFFLAAICDRERAEFLLRGPNYAKLAPVCGIMEAMITAKVSGSKSAQESELDGRASSFSESVVWE